MVYQKMQEEYNVRSSAAVYKETDEQKDQFKSSKAAVKHVDLWARTK